MRGNRTLPGVLPGQPHRDPGTIWRGYVESTWFRAVQVSGDSEEPSKIPLGTILIENLTDGTYSPMKEADILTDAASMPGPRLVIVADHTGRSGTTETVDGETVKEDSTILVGIMGQVSIERLIIGGKNYTELDESQQRCLKTQLASWHFDGVFVFQA